MRKVIGLDIGGTNTRAALINEDYSIEKIVIHDTVSGSLEGFLESVSSIIEELCPDRKEVVAIAGGVPGRVRHDGYIYALPNIHIDSIPLQEYLEKRFSLPVKIINDAEVASLAEANVGPYKDAKSLYFVTISTGVGGALTINGELRNSSYEVGHTLFEYKGKNYEFEKIASGTGIKTLCELNGIKIASAKQFFDGVREGKKDFLPVYEDWIDLLSRFFKMIQSLFEPEIIALTGGVMKSSDLFFEKLKSACPNSRLLPCAHGQEAGLLGAGVLAFQSLN